MLRQRVITALLLLAVLLPALFYPDPRAFAAVTLVLIVAGAWEWGRLNASGSIAALGMGAGCVLLCAGAWASDLLQRPTPLLWQVVGPVWVMAGLWVLRRGVAGWAAVPRALRLAGGLAVLALAWLAVAQARVVGINFLLSVLLLVWAADIFAYFAGRALGRHKLAPAISPGKSWEGVWGGFVGVLLLALCWLWADERASAPVASLYTRLQSHSGWWLALAVPLLVASSVVGDLLESLVKRSAGVKDSSGLLPGHGGVLDRVDALLPTVPIAMMMVSW